MFILKCCLQLSKGRLHLFSITSLSFILAHTGVVSDLNSLSRFLLPQYVVLQIGMQIMKHLFALKLRKKFASGHRILVLEPFVYASLFRSLDHLRLAENGGFFFSLGNFWSWGKYKTKYCSENWQSLYAVLINFACHCFCYWV